MKLIYAIISNDDSESVILKLNRAGYQATKLSSTGGFLKKGNSTLLIGTEDEDMPKVIKIVENVCGERKEIEVNMPYVNTISNGPLCFSSVPQKIEIGGAIIFAVNVDYYEKI